MTTPTLLWLRRDLRLDDHPALYAALGRRGPVIPVFILDPETEALGAAHRWRLAESLDSLGKALEGLGSRLVLRRGDALETLRALAQETGATGVRWSRLYDRAARARDEKVKAALKEDGLDVRSCNGSLIFEPWEVETQAGGFYKVYSPFARAARALEIPEPLSPVGAIPAPDEWPASDALSDWALGADMRRGAAVLARHAAVGEEAARDRLDAFLEDKAEAYKAERDRLDLDACSGLSENLAYGEISPRRIWQATRDRGPDGKGSEHFLSEVLWREFAYHLVHHTPRIETGNWREEWDAFPWRDDNADAEAWRRGMTGVDLVDAAMREVYVTGRMHNRARMLVASYLTKHLMTHWRVGEAWFRDVLTDWDPASNAMGWQWTAGSGPDAAPFFRIFNPDGQAEKFDAEARYRDHWLKGKGAEEFYAAIPKSWGIDAQTRRPAEPIMPLKPGRERALEAYEALKAA
ncbi:cryptochrome/photolyase family protein [Rhodovulum sp. DZ06]|uniref:cryptochrome/photolyase family protein n=1 Tax=Rhodovulum sp. DZ06 TaxID=3425126 RepID=UPI003D33C7BB